MDLKKLKIRIVKYEVQAFSNKDFLSLSSKNTESKVWLAMKERKMILQKDATKPGLGSTDMGIVSQIFPSIHPMLGIGEKEAVNHMSALKEKIEDAKFQMENEQNFAKDSLEY